MPSEGRQRIDRWLFFARAVKSRSLAAKLVQTGRVRLNGGRIDQAARAVGPGDVLTLTLDRRIMVLRVLDIGTRRGPAEEARQLYEDLSPPPADRTDAPRDAIPGLREKGSGRPTKKERRATERWRRSEEP